jgi:hypothetical protein
MSQEIERRFYTAELLLDEADGRPRIAGYAAVFNQLSEEMFGFREIIMPGAFAEAIKGDVRALWNHNPDYVLGRSVSGSLILTEDDHGLRYEITPPESTWAQDLLLSIRRKDVDQSSFGFRVNTEDQEWHEVDGQVTRTLLKISRLFDVSPVTFPAYPTTTSEARAMGERLASEAGSQATAGGAGDQAAVGRRDLMRRRLKLLEL